VPEYSVKLVDALKPIWVVKSDEHPGWVDHRTFGSRRGAELFKEFLEKEVRKIENSDRDRGL